MGWEVVTGEVKGKQGPDCERPQTAAKEPRLYLRTTEGGDRCMEDNDMTIFKSPVFDIQMSSQGVRMAGMASEDRERKTVLVSAELPVKGWGGDLASKHPDTHSSEHTCQLRSSPLLSNADADLGSQLSMCDCVLNL